MLSPKHISIARQEEHVIQHRPGHLRIGQILIHLEIATPHQVSEARLNQMQLKRSPRLGEIMIKLGHINEEGLNRALSIQRDLDISDVFDDIPIE